MIILAVIFWASLALIFYAYIGYPIVLTLIGLARPRPVHAADADFTPKVTVLVPVHNEGRVIREKLQNLAALDYPRDALEILIVSDGSTDDTAAIVREFEGDGVRLLEVADRRGKANALNVGLEGLRGEIVVFTDASIMLRSDALRCIVQPFSDPEVGCVSGEDRIEEGGGEGAYGRYELFLRRQESRIASIVGASGSFYAERAEICRPFVEGVAPDFLSVLNAVEAGHRAVSEPEAVGFMRSVKDPRDEFRRKVRTLVRGFAGLAAKRHMLNPIRYGLFAFVLFSHKVVRWLVPIFMIAALISNIVLAGSWLYTALLAAQLAGYGLALVAFLGLPALGGMLPARLCLYFVNVNLAILYAWTVYLRGTRLEVWTPSQRHG